MKWEDALNSLELKFTSGNDIPITRSTITIDEFEALKNKNIHKEMEKTLIKFYDEEDNLIGEFTVDSLYDLADKHNEHNCDKNCPFCYSRTKITKQDLLKLKTMTNRDFLYTSII